MKHFFVFLIAVLLFIVPAVTYGDAHPTSLELWYSSSEAIDTDVIGGYYESATSAFDRLGLLIVDTIAPKTPRGRAATFAFAFAPLTVNQVLLAAAAHEYGHFRAYSRAGVRHFGFGIFNSYGMFQANPFTAYSVLIAAAFGTSFYATVPKDEFIALVGKDFDTYVMLSKAGGLNEGEHRAENDALKLMFGNALLADALSYFVNTAMIPTFRLGSGPDGDRVISFDIDGYIDGIGKSGIPATTRLVKLLQFVKLASNATLSYLYGAYRYVATGEMNVHPIPYWPQFGTYLTLRGPTVKAMSVFGLGNARFTPSYEQSFGDYSSEAGLRVSLPFLKFFRNDAGAYYHFAAQGFWLEDALYFVPFPGLTVGGKWYYGAGYTFRRDIVGNSGITAPTESGWKAAVNLTLRF